jgi:hypothetical protein
VIERAFRGPAQEFDVRIQRGRGPGKSAAHNGARGRIERHVGTIARNVDAERVAPARKHELFDGLRLANFERSAEHDRRRDGFAVLDVDSGSEQEARREPARDQHAAALRFALKDAWLGHSLHKRREGQVIARRQEIGLREIDGQPIVQRVLEGVRIEGP